MAELEALGEEQYRRIFRNHGAPEPLFGVKVEALKNIQKRIRKDHTLSMELFATQNPDAQYLATLIADEKQLTEADLDAWAQTASWHMISESGVAAVAAKSANGWMLARKWVDSTDPQLQSTGWATIAQLLAVRKNDAPDVSWLLALLQRIAAEIDGAANRVRYTMNGFIIACGCYVPELAGAALDTAQKVGKVTVYMGNTSCKVPDATGYILKVQARNADAKKKTPGGKA